MDGSKLNGVVVTITVSMPTKNRSKASTVASWEFPCSISRTRSKSESSSLASNFFNFDLSSASFVYFDVVLWEEMGKIF